MKTLMLLIAAISLTWSATCLASPDFEQPRELSYIEDRGGLRLTEPYKKNNRWWLALECNVSGIKKITVTPKTIHSGLAWSKSVANVDENRIYLSIYTAMQGPRAPSAACGDAPLAHAPGGVYQVYYLDPDETTHSLGTVELR